MFILLSAFTESPQNVFPIFRAETNEELGKLISAESRINAETNAVEWVPTSQWAKFIHPQVVIDQGMYPIQEVVGNTKEEFMANVIADAEAQWEQLMAVPTKLDHYTTTAESGIDPDAIAAEAGALVAVTGLEEAAQPTIAERITAVADACGGDCNTCDNNVADRDENGDSAAVRADDEIFGEANR
jgi:hypothetical protein